MYFKCLLSFIPLALMLSACGYYPAHTDLLPQHIKRIAVVPFENKTAIPSLEEKMSLAISREFLRDGRVEVTTPNRAHARVEGAITRYIKEPVSFDDNHVVQEYKIWVLIDMQVVDQTKTPNEVVFLERGIQGITRYFVISQGGNLPKTEEEAREEIWDNLARNIVRRTYVGFGSVSGESDRKIKAGPSVSGTTTSTATTPSGAPIIP